MRKNDNNYNTSAHLTYLCRYHVVFCPKYRRKILTDGKDIKLKEIFIEPAEKHGFEILQMEVMPDHVHLLISCNPRYGIMECIKNLKYESAHILLKEFPDIRHRIPSMWTRSVFVATAGSVSLDVVKQYIENQKGK